jgi:hypothetical protein
VPLTTKAVAAQTAFAYFSRRQSLMPLMTELLPPRTSANPIASYPPREPIDKAVGALDNCLDRRRKADAADDKAVVPRHLPMQPRLRSADDKATAAQISANKATQSRCSLVTADGANANAVAAKKAMVLTQPLPPRPLLLLPSKGRCCPNVCRCSLTVKLLLHRYLPIRKRLQIPLATKQMPTIKPLLPRSANHSTGICQCRRRQSYCRPDSCYFSRRLKLMPLMTELAAQTSANSILVSAQGADDKAAAALTTALDRRRQS